MCHVLLLVAEALCVCRATQDIVFTWHLTEFVNEIVKLTPKPNSANSMLSGQHHSSYTDPYTVKAMENDIPQIKV